MYLLTSKSLFAEDFIAASVRFYLSDCPSDPPVIRYSLRRNGELSRKHTTK